MSYDVLTIGTDKALVGINPEGGYVSSWKMRQGENDAFEDILYVGTQLKRSGIPVLFPFFGKSEKWPQHGFGRNCTWRVVEQSEERAVMELDNDDLTDEIRLWYPYVFTVRITVEVGEQEELLYSLNVRNTGEHELPIVPGLHPYWANAHENKKSLEIEGIAGFDARAIDWDQNPPDTKFDFSDKAVVKMPGREITIEEVTDGGSVIKHLVVWSLTPVRDPDFNFVCVEPVCGYNYDIDNNPILVAPGTEWSMSVRFACSFK